MINRGVYGGLLSIMLLTGGLLGCGDGGATESKTAGKHSGTYPYQIVTTCGMVTDIVRQVAGDKANVQGLMGETVDPHLYKPTRHDVTLLQSADVIFYSGLMLEGRMADTFARVGRDGKPVYAVTEGIDPKLLREPPEFAGHFDPHVWMDVSAWSQCVAFVATALGEFDPPNAALYQQNAEAYRAELKKLDDYVRQSINTIPKPQRVLVTAHDAFGYFGHAYDIEVQSVQGITTESEASVKDINDLVNFVTERKVQALFVESSVSSQNIQAVIEGAQRKGAKVEIGGNLFSDAMGQTGTYEGTYIGMIDHNVTAITRALGGQAPEAGMQGKLNLEP